jgi:maltose-binding protein MalE
MLYWNRDMLQEGGFDAEKGPQTWADLTAMTKKLAVVKDGKLDRMGFQTSSNDFRYGVYNNGGLILDPESGLSKVNDPKAVAAMQYALDLVEAQGGNDLVSAARAAFKDAQLNDPLLAGKGAIIQSGVFTVNLIKQQAPQLSWKIGKLPHGPGGESRDLVLGSWTNALPSKGKNADQAWELSKYLSYGEGHQEFMKIQARPAMVRKYNQPPNDADQRRDNPYWDTVLEILGSTVSYPSSDKLGQVDKLVNEAYDNVVARKMKPEEAVGWVDKEIAKVVDQG